MDKKNSEHSEQNKYNEQFSAFKNEYKEIQDFGKILVCSLDNKEESEESKTKEVSKTNEESKTKEVSETNEESKARKVSKTREVKYNGKNCVAKLVEKKQGSFYNEKIKGPYFIKIITILEKKIDKKEYNLIIMEKALLKDLGYMKDHLHGKKNLYFINSPFTEKVGENLLRYFAKQIVEGLESLERNELVHCDIKPENILINPGFKLKISDFSFLINLKENKDQTKFKIPDGTNGYVTPETFISSEMDANTAKKQDYFALGATLFLLKFGEQRLKYKKYEDDKISKMTEDRLIDLLQRDINQIQTHPLIDNDFITFLCSLIHYLPEERPTFEEIYRDKWLNKNEDIIEFIINSAFEEEEEDRLHKELLKSDFLLEKEITYKKERSEIKTQHKKKKSNFIFIDDKK